MSITVNGKPVSKITFHIVYRSRNPNFKCWDKDNKPIPCYDCVTCTYNLITGEFTKETNEYIRDIRIEIGVWDKEVLSIFIDYPDEILEYEYEKAVLETGEKLIDHLIRKFGEENVEIINDRSASVIHTTTDGMDLNLKELKEDTIAYSTTKFFALRIVGIE